MELFKYIDTNPWGNGVSINGYDSVSWVERYREPGEFTIECRLSSGLREFLPLGTFISHVNTKHVMIVENHYIEERDNEDTKLTISGRSMVVILDNRVVGGDQLWGAPMQNQYVLEFYTREGTDSSHLGQAVVNIINTHMMNNSGTANVSDRVPFVTARNTILFVVGVTTTVQRVQLKRASLLTTCLELLAQKDYGLRAVRPPHVEINGNTVSNSQQKEIMLEVTEGNDRTRTVSFSSAMGDIKSADYLYTLKGYKNAAVITGKFVESVYHGTESGLNKRTLAVDGSDIDSVLTAIPTGTTLDNYRLQMQYRGEQVLANMSPVTLVNINVSPNQKYRYRTDYDIGDKVTITTTFGETLAARVVEYAEIEDENGASSYPTLDIL